MSNEEREKKQADLLTICQKAKRTNQDIKTMMYLCIDNSTTIKILFYSNNITIAKTIFFDKQSFALVEYDFLMKQISGLIR